MDETKVQIGENVLLDIGTHSDWYISAVSYDGESVNVDLRRKADRHKEWWLADTPQTETQTETQNSNLTFEKRTMRDCYNCKRYETEDECIECHYEPKDECAKEYEELGLKELKELIKADRKTDNSSENPNNCEPQKSCSTCGYSTLTPSCDTCEGYSNWWSLEDVPTGYNLSPVEDEPQTERSESTDCAWK